MVRGLRIATPGWHLMEEAAFSIRDRQRVGWGFWVRWMAATASGLSATAYGFWYASDAWNRVIVLSPRIDQLVGFSLLLAVLGAGVGVMQWLVLRRELSQAGWWVAATMSGVVVVGVGLAVAWAYDVVFQDGRFDVVGPQPVIASLAAFAAIGVMQWLVLRRQVARAGWWVLANVLGFVGGYLLGVSIALALANVLCDAGLVGCSGPLTSYGATVYAFPPSFGTAFGGVTGAAMVWMLRRSTRQTRELAHEESSAGLA